MTINSHASIAGIGDRIGRLICGHIELLFRDILSGDGVEFDPRFVRLVTGEPHPFGNFACMVDAADVDGTKAAIGPLMGCGAPSVVFFTGLVSNDVEQELSSCGFQRHGGLPAMAVEIEKMSGDLLPAGYVFARVNNAAEHDAWAEVFARGYGLPLPVGSAFAGGIRGDMAEDAPLQYFWILKDGKPVSTSMLYLKDGVAGIYGVATLPEERGKGLGAFVTAEPLRVAHRLGYRVGVLQASEDGHPVYRRIGFKDFGEVALYVRIPG